MSDYHSDSHFYLKMFYEYLSEVEVSEVRYHHVLLNFPGSEPNLKLCQQSLALGLFLFAVYNKNLICFNRLNIILVM